MLLWLRIKSVFYFTCFYDIYNLAYWFFDFSQLFYQIEWTCWICATLHEFVKSRLNLYRIAVKSQWKVITDQRLVPRRKVHHEDVTLLDSAAKLSPMATRVTLVSNTVVCHHTTWSSHENSDSEPCAQFYDSQRCKQYERIFMMLEWVKFLDIWNLSFKCWNLK